MGGMRIFVSRLLGLFRRRRLSEDLDAEVQSHLQLLTEENIRRGMSPKEAEYAARREFGGIEQTKLLYREQQALPFVDTLLQDVKFAGRMLIKRPGFAVIAVLTLAVGIGATTAVFSVVDRILFRSLPYPNDQRLVSFGGESPV